MNRKKTTTERFAFFVESIKKNIVTYLRETDKLARDLRKANGDTDKQARTRCWCRFCARRSRCTPPRPRGVGARVAGGRGTTH